MSGRAFEGRRFAALDLSSLVNGAWPFHGPATLDRDTILQRVFDGLYDGDESWTFWIVEGGERVGLIRLFDLADVPEGGTPLFDLRVDSAHRGRGLGGQALARLTGYLFTEFPGLQRIEGTTRMDNRAMRRTFLSSGYAKEAHYRDAWPGKQGRVHHLFSKLTGDQRSELIKLLGTMAEAESDSGRRELLEGFPEGFGLIDAAV
ncbi:GNAT family protein [Streptomyces sp. PvR034]|uniref:GNAT family N-acetyltransferase n=1 Tax=Streptomyces sp. PvR034 TaxID=3156401 RepID=UPI0033957EB3